MGYDTQDRADLTGSVGSVTGAVGSVTAGVTLADGAIDTAKIVDGAFTAGDPVDPDYRTPWPGGR